ncbi:tyrosyl-DNA phosphodiesterase-domain-containing protein [Limtongia smithiae]|uniref:tyrosyl-DNA phosphodiesterase-domain-containing protein n=1 Tax=Limtongia smithiae TaxID=1125753 RepID=UPI0034CF9EEC
MEEKTVKPSFLASMDRAAMERERLLRISRADGGGRPKRPRSPSVELIETYEISSSPESSGDAPVEVSSASPDDTSIESTIRTTAAAVNRARSTATMEMESGSDTKRMREDLIERIPYPRGVVKKTAVNGYARHGDDITINEVLQPTKLRTAVLSAFQWEFEWIFDKLFLGRTRMVLVVAAKGAQVQEQTRSMFKEVPNVRVCMPNMDGMINCMHSKVQLLFYDSYLRVCIPSANLTHYDWGEGAGVLENIMYIHDFPLVVTGTRELPEFALSLIYFLEAQDMFDDILQRLRREVSWANCENVRFVHSIGGEHREERAIWRTGYPSLSTAVRSFGGVGAPAEVDYLISSLGSVNPIFAESIYQAATGAQISISRPPKSSDSLFSLVKSKLRVYFPSHDTVAACKGGLGSAGTICFNRSFWTRPAFPKEIVRDAKSVRDGCLMHDKVMFIRFQNPVIDADGVRSMALAYVGSANMSESAWGKLVNDQLSKRMKLNLRNWECGVLLRVPLNTVGPSSGSSGIALKSVEESFSGTVPVPMHTKGTEFGHKVPWFFTEREWASH